MALSPQPPRTPVVAVATVSYGSGDVLEGFLESVPASSAGPVVIVIANNDSADAAVAQFAAVLSRLPTSGSQSGLRRRDE